MKLRIDNILALTAILAAAQFGASACAIADDTDATERNVDAGPKGGKSDDANGGKSDDLSDEGDASLGDDVSDEGDAGPGDDVSDAGDAGAGAWSDDAGVALRDAGNVAGNPEEEESTEGAVECFGGTFEPAINPTDCAVFDACYEDPSYIGSASSICWHVANHRRAAVYEGFIACVNAAELEDPCAEEADLVVEECDYHAEQMACAEPNDTCTEIAANCDDADVLFCPRFLAPFTTDFRDWFASCIDERFFPNVETLGPNYEGCLYDFWACVPG